MLLTSVTKILDPSLNRYEVSKYFLLNLNKIKDEYPKIIESISLSEVNSAIKKYVNPNKLYMVAAGTL